MQEKMAGDRGISYLCAGCSRTNIPSIVLEKFGVTVSYTA